MCVPKVMVLQVRILVMLFVGFQPCMLAQKSSLPVSLKTGTVNLDIIPSNGIDPRSVFYQLEQFEGKLFLFLQFRSIPSVAETLLASDFCSSRTIRSAYDFSVVQYSGPSTTVNATLYDNIVSSYKFIPPSNFDLIPFDKGYYAEVPAAGRSGEYYITAPPADSVLTDLQASATDKTKNIIQWSNTDTAVVRYELEVARDAVTAREGSFHSLRSLIASGKDYEVIDSAANPSWYRLKLIYSNGCIGYSSVKWTASGGEITFRIFPNPSSSGIYAVLPSDPIPGTVNWEVTNTLGQLIFRKQTTSAGTYDKIIIDLSKLAVSKGIYQLGINWQGGKQTMKLIRF